MTPRYVQGSASFVKGCPELSATVSVLTLDVTEWMFDAFVVVACIGRDLAGTVEVECGSQKVEVRVLEARELVEEIVRREVRSKT